MTPTPVLLPQGVIRVYGGIRDTHGVSRISYFDVMPESPSRIVNKCTAPVLDIGQPGMFDDNGVILGDVIIEQNGVIRMYYVGFQIVNKVKFFAFTGIAESTDNGNTFQRLLNTPILDRGENRYFIGAIHSVNREESRISAWYAGGSSWETIKGSPFPRYEIFRATAGTGLDFSQHKQCLTVRGEEYRIGRPRVVKVVSVDTPFLMWFTFGTVSGQYEVGLAASKDGVNWVRDYSYRFLREDNAGLWESNMVCYAAPLTIGNRMLAFYNGNGMGITGVGVAESRLDEVLR